jgi:hypothetical protein
MSATLGLTCFLRQVKEQEAREASQIAKRKQFDLEAAEQARQQAREWEEKQEKLRARNACSKAQATAKINFRIFVPAAPKEPEKSSRILEVDCFQHFEDRRTY